MPLYRISLKALGAAALLLLALACKGKSDETTAASAKTATISGTVTYKRVPLAKGADGLPTGLVDAGVEANLQNLPARGVQVRAFQKVEQTTPDGAKVLVWIKAGQAWTDASGKFAMLVNNKDRLTMVEVHSTFGGGAHEINVVGEPTGLDSTTPALDRLHYALRKAVDGSAPANVNAPTSMLSGDITVDFSVGLNDEWWLINPAYNLSNGEAPLVDQAVLETTVAGRTPGLGTGSRILGIGDTIADVVLKYGNASPGAVLDLHYWPGRSETRGSYVEYDRSRFPQAYDSYAGVFRYFGSLRGGSANDDAWDEGVILPLMTRNTFVAALANRTFSVPLNPLFPPAAALPDLAPEMARIEGLVEVMAANLLKSPYLADTQGTGLASPLKDVRDLTGVDPIQRNPYSAPALRAFAWEVVLKANSLPSPGTPSDWTKINPLAAARFFLTPTAFTNGATDSTARDKEPFNIYTQIPRLQEAKGSAEPVDLAAIFTNEALTTLAAPFGLPWPRPTTGAYASFLADWGTDPNGATTPLAPVALSMAKAVQVDGAYPNLSQGEVFYAGFNLSADKRYTLSVTISPALASGAGIDLDLPRALRTFTFTGSGGTTEAFVLPMNASTAPYYHPVRLRMKSPGAIQPDVSVTVSFNPSL